MPETLYVSPNAQQYLASRGQQPGGGGQESSIAGRSVPNTNNLDNAARDAIQKGIGAGLGAIFGK